MPWPVVLVIAIILLCMDGPLPFGDGIAAVMIILKGFAAGRSRSGSQIGEGRR